MSATNPLSRISPVMMVSPGRVVSGSVPEAELRETRLKLRALLAPLTEI